MSRTARAALLSAMSAALVALGACAVDQRMEVDRYRGVLSAGRFGEAEPLRAGEPLSLDHAVRLTNAANEQLSLEGERYLQALIDRQRNAAALLPTLDLFGSLTVREKAGSGGVGATGASATREPVLFDGGLRAQYTLFTGLSDFNRLKAADLTIEQRWWTLLDVRESLLLETVRAYYSVLLAERQASVLESSLKVQEERLRDIRGRQEVGFARPLDVAQIEAQASETRVALLDARNAVQNARAALTLLTGADLADRALSDGFTPAIEPPTEDGLARLAADHRHDVAATIAAASAARAGVDAQIGRYYPSITVNFDYFLTRDTPPTDRDWSGLLTLNLPIFSAGRIDADVRDAWSRFRQAVLTYSLALRQVGRDIAVAHADLTATRARVAETANQVRAAREALRQAEAAYGAGLGTNLERITAQDQLLSAQLRSAREEYNAKIAYLAAMRAAGVLAESLAGGPIVFERPPTRRAVPESPFIVLPVSDRVMTSEER